jgi:hypothetical protein
VQNAPSLERKKAREDKVIRNAMSNEVDSAWGSQKDVAREIEAAVSAVTRSLELRMRS